LSVPLSVQDVQWEEESRREGEKKRIGFGEKSNNPNLNCGA